MTAVCSVPALKFIHELSLQASSNQTCDIGIVSFSFSIDKSLILWSTNSTHSKVALPLQKMFSLIRGTFFPYSVISIILLSTSIEVVMFDY